MTQRRATIALLLIVALGCAARCGVIWLRSDELTQDRDAYLGIAAGIAEGRGYSSPGSTRPTAYRPPLYPLVLAASPWDSIGRWVATVNLLCGAATILVTAALALRLQLKPALALLAAALVALDPLLVRYASLPMTESLSTLLVTLLLWHLAGRLDSAGRMATAGILLGLNVLCRPTVWAFAGLMAVWVASAAWWRHRTSTKGIDRESTNGRMLAARAGWLALGTAIVVGPWVLRNWLVLESPVLNTTHGGYTLLLGNNPRFYEEVVRQPWGTVWDGSRGPGQAAWVRGVQREMRDEGIVGEVAEDRWMGRRARRHIADDPGGFLAAAWLRLVRFWSPLPAGEAKAGFPAAASFAAAAYVGIADLLALIGLGGLISLRWKRRFADANPAVRRGWIAALLMVAGFMTVHLAYWSNARMRAPVVPVVALLAAHGVGIVFANRRSDDS